MSGAFRLAPQDWAALRALLDQALALPPAERAPWLDALPDDARHALLRPHLRELLAHAGGPLIDTLPGVETASFASPPPGGVEAGTQVGPYRLLRPLGEGGMASVWLAERTDMLQRRQVALKLPHGAWRRAGLHERMAREREILATLEHPHIARLYDAGVAADGQPYLALEFVEGERLDAWCDRRALDVPARLRLFLQVARAVAYAHAQLVVHRDLKPSNILVTADGQAKLLDFGIAKLLDQGHAEETALTQQSGRAMTPDYAAPEQILGRPIGTAADVYALGVVLFELLCGRRPYRLERDTRAALEDAILHADVPRPSSVAPQERAKALRGDLDTVMLKALKHDPAERYATVAALAEDLQRHLDRRPVLAQPDSWRYRAGRLFARHRVAIVAGAGVALALAAAAGVSVWQLFEALAQRDRATYQQARATASNDFLNLLLEDLGSADKPRTLVEVLDRSTALLEKQYDSNERLFASMLYEASRRYATLQKGSRELTLLDRVSASARRLGDLDLLARSECSAARLLLESDRRAAVARYAEATQALPRASADAAWVCVRTQAAMQEAEGDAAGAMATLKRAVDASDPALPMPPVTEQALLGELGRMQHKADDIAGALVTTERALRAIDRAGLGGTMTKAVWLINLGAVLTRAGEVQEALARQHEALALIRQVEADGEPPMGFATHLATSLQRMAQHDLAASHALADAERAQRAGNHRLAGSATLVAARSLTKIGQTERATQLLAEAETRMRANEKANQRLLNEVALSRADLLLQTGQLDAARAEVDRVLAQMGYPARTQAPGLSSALHVGARVALAQKDYATAEPWAALSAERAARAARDPKRSADVGQAWFNRSQALAGLGRIAEARAQADLAWTALRAGFGADHPETRAAERQRASLAEAPAR